MYLAVLIGSSVVLLSTTRDAGDSDAGSNPALSKQWSRDYPIDVPHSPMLTFATKKLSTGANGQKEDAASWVQTLPWVSHWASSGHVTTRSMSLRSYAPRC